MKRGSKWYRVCFADGAFIYLPFNLTSIKKVAKNAKIHGKITGFRKMETRL